jgi:hypothetical protein
MRPPRWSGVLNAVIQDHTAGGRHRPDHLEELQVIRVWKLIVEQDDVRSGNVADPLERFPRVAGFGDGVARSSARVSDIDHLINGSSSTYQHVQPRGFFPYFAKYFRSHDVAPECDEPPSRDVRGRGVGAA